MAKTAGRETELVLENRQVLGIFLGIALLCGVFFALGYVVGRNTFSPVTTLAQGEEEITHSGEKPSAMLAPAYIPRNPAASQPSTGAETDLNFYQSVEEKQPEARLLPPESRAAGSAPVSPLAVEPPPAGILVQVSALTRREDAESLLQLLKEKNLPVLVTSGTNDALFHVVVGPYQNEREADRVKRLLEQEGFRPFVRH